MSNRFFRNDRLLFSTRICTYVSPFFSPFLFSIFIFIFVYFRSVSSALSAVMLAIFSAYSPVPGGCIYFIRAHFRPSGLLKFIPENFSEPCNSDCSTRYNRNSSTTGFSAVAIHRVSLYPAPFLFAFFHSFVPGGSFFFIYFHFMSDCEKVD